MNTKNIRPLVITLIALVSFASVSAGADNAQRKKNWNQNHPRRHEVNKRLNNQQKRTDQGLANGSLNQQQANKIQNQDSRIRSQEQRDAARNGGHITQAEQRQLNREENGVSREINHDERINKAARSAPAAPAAPAAPTSGQ